MPRPLFLLGFALLLPAAARAETPVSFRQDVVPLLTRHGCNQGACHGTPQGKNGFRLSLRGYDPALDHHTLTREAQGRRVNPLDPDASLVLLKATARVPHEGGRRFAPGDPAYALLRRWVAAGAADDAATAPRLARLQIVPERPVLEAPTATQQFQVLAHTADGAARDVTHLARFGVADEAAAKVSLGGRAEMLKKGEAAVIAEYRGVMAISQVLYLPKEPPFAWPDPPANNYIDELVFAKLRRLRIEPSGLAPDEEFLRRVYLDAIGRLPTPDEARRFLADKDVRKRDRLIDELLDRPEFADWWALKWADRLGCNQRFVGKVGAVKYHQWVRRAVVDNVPEDEFVRSILTAQGGNYENPPAGFYRRLRDPQARAEEVAQLFLGVRLQCARCHNHPGERWTQDDYHALAAFFARVQYRDGPFFVQQYDKEETVYLPRDGEVVHPGTGQAVAPKFLGGGQPALRPGEDRREALARWLTAKDNPFFARAAVNRVWYHLLGRGIVDPVDDLRGTNPPANAELLDALADDFIRHNFDRKYLIKTVLRSRTYQLSSKPTATNADDEKYFSHARVRLLGAEQLLDAVCAATGVAEKFPGLPLGTPAAALPDGEYKHPFLEAFGRPARAMACECERGTDTNLTQALQLVGGRVVHDKVKSDAGRVARLLAAGKADAELLDELFLAALGRHPSEAERQALAKRLAGADRRKAAEDVLWALLNHNEFLFQH